ncbi:MAG: glycosyltransferase [Pirellulales bacterium]
MPSRSVSSRPPREPQADTPVRFGFIGTLTETKGLSVLLEEYLRVRDSLKRETELLVAGTGVASYEKELKERFTHPQIEFLGRVKPEEFFNQIDCSVVPSIWEEPFPTVVLESLGAGVPVLGARRGGIPEMVQHEHNGLLFDPIADGELGSAFAALAENETQLITLQNQARPSIAHLLDTDAWIDRYEALFARVVERAHLKANSAS